MKKRLIVLVLMLFAAFGFVACNGSTTGGSTTSTQVTVPEQAAAPTGLSISGKVLSWSAVPNVTQYVVYVNGTERATVNATTYDFSAITGDRLIFQVVAVGKQGVLDSPKSASLAYVANPTQEITQIQTALEGNAYLNGAPEEFAAELVRKGVVSEDIDSDLTALDTFMAAVEAADGNFVAINAALTAFLASLSNYEAYISAMMILLPPQIAQEAENLQDDIDYKEEQIQYLQEQIDWWQTEKTNPSSWYTPEECQMYIDWNNESIADYQDRIDSLEAQIAQIQNMAQTMEDQGDELTLAVTRVVAYLIDLQGDITVTLLTNLQALVESEDRPTAAEILAVKDEAVNILLANLPSLSDLTLVYEMVFVMQSALTDTTNTLSGYANETALQTRLSLELGLRFLLSLNQAFLDELFRIEDESRSETEMSVEMGIHVMQAVNSFEATQSALIAQIEGVFSEAQRQDIYESGIAASLEMLVVSGIPQAQLDAITAMLDEMDFATINGIAAIFEDQASKLFDYFIATDGEVFRAIAQVGSFDEEYDWQEDDYVYYNTYTDTVLANYTAYRYQKNLAAFRMIGEVVKVIDASLATVSENQLTSLVDFIASIVPSLVFNFNDEMTEVDPADVTALINAFKTALANQDANALALFGQLTDYMIAEDVTGEFSTLVQTLNAYNTIQYGANYLESEAYDEGYDMRAQIILIANHLNAFMNPARRALLDGIINEAFAFMRTPEFLELNGMTLENVNAMESDVEGMINDLLAQVAVVAGYNYQSLTGQQIEEIQTLLEMLPMGKGIR
jgi:hypothetical protein